MFKKNINRVRQFCNYINPKKWLAVRYIKRANYQEYLKPPFGRFNERPIEYHFVFEQISRFYPKTVLDVGTGLTALPHLIANCGCKVTAIDNIKDYWPKGMFNRHYYIINDDITDSKLQEKFDMVVSVSALEHIKKFDQAVKEIFRLTKNGGYVVLSFPYNEKMGVDNVYTLPNSNVKELLSYTTRAYCRDDLERWEKENDASIINQEYWRFFDGDYWTVGEEIIPPKKVTRDDLHQISCVVFRKK